MLSVVMTLLLALTLRADSAHLPEAEVLDTRTSGHAQGVNSFSSRGVAFSQRIGPDGSKESACAFSTNEGDQIEVRSVQEKGQSPTFTLIEGPPGLNPEEAYDACVAEQGQLSGSGGIGGMGSFPFFGTGGTGALPSFPDFSGLLPGFQLGPGAAGAEGAPEESVPSSNTNLLGLISASLAAQREAMNAFYEQMMTQFSTLRQQNKDLQNQISHSNPDAEPFLQ